MLNVEVLGQVITGYFGHVMLQYDVTISTR
jgi:hypothetical protein